MNYYVARNGQVFGPYTEETVKSYFAAGSLLASDNIRAETSQEWTTIGQLLGVPQAMPLVATLPQGYAPQGGIVPPNLHWFLLLLLCITWVFPFIWALVQAKYAKKIDQASGAMVAYVLWFLCSAAGIAADVMVVLGKIPAADASLITLISVGSFIAYVFGSFNIRKSMMSYYNTVEPIQLNLSGVLTFFFGIFYLQYHMSRIARWKRTGVLG